MTDQLPPFTRALTWLAGRLSIGERFTLDRYGKSITFDAKCDSLPFRVRSQIESQVEREAFVGRVVPPDQTGPTLDLAAGLAWLRNGDRLHVMRGIADYRIIHEVIRPDRDLRRAEITISREVVLDGLDGELAELRRRVDL